MTELVGTGSAPRGEVPTPPTTREIAERYLERVRIFSSAPTAAEHLPALLDLFTEDVIWDIPGDTSRVSWIGRRHGREGVAHFFRELVALVEPKRFEVRAILADEQTVVVLGDLASTVRATGRLIESPFAIELGIRQGRIARYLLLEDSHAVALAAG